jgi:hypothetical protein
MYIIGCYASYLLISLAVTIWVARTLHKNGRIFLVDAFNGNAELADSVNHLLVVGFYLINIGYVALALRTYENLNTLRGSIELVSDKVESSCSCLAACTSLICSSFRACANALRRTLVRMPLWRIQRHGCNS